MFTDLREAYESWPSLKETTDKDTTHSYLPVYIEKFQPYKDATAVIELGVGIGGSIKLWELFFTSATVYGIDVTYSATVEKYDRAICLTADGYSDDTVAQFPDNYFDVIVEDGPHSFESQLECIRKYYAKLKPGGIMAIEDIQCEDHFNQLARVAEKYTSKVEKHDLRGVKGRYDDLLIILYKE